MRKIIIILTTLIICCCADCYAQGRVTREKKEKKERTERRQDPPKKKAEPAPSNPVASSKPTSGYINGHEWVDLGLSVKWATCNVGATSPEGYGDYFAWGETSTKSSYTEDNSKTYGKTVSTLQREGVIDGAGNLTTAYDAARTNWGSTWRMPTEEEFDELVKNCKWEWTTRGGKNSYKVTGSNGNSIFLPAAGGRHGSSLYFAGGSGDYWSSSVYDGSDSAYGLYFGSGNHRTGWRNRDYGRSVRPVADKAKHIGFI